MNISDVERRAVKLSDDTINNWIGGIQRFPIVTMCGSTKFKEDYLRCIEDLTYHGALVLFCPIFHHADGIKIPEDKVQMIRGIHMQRIRMCKAIFVVNKDGYIGNSTKEEIEYAISLGKDVWYMEHINKKEEVSTMKTDELGMVVGAIAGKGPELAKVVKVISAFPGVGKSWMFNNQQKLGIKVSDSDSSNYSWLSKGVRHPDFPNNYIDHIKDAMQTNDVVLVSSHDVVRDALTQAGIEFLTVYPNISDKDEYLQRFVKRGSDQAFVKLINDNWDEWISNINKNAGDLHVELNLGEYLSDFVLDRHTKDSKLSFSIKGTF